MERPTAPAASNDYWYVQPGEVNTWFYGVFEGGGAKGVAYVGALQAMRKEKCWFSAVAGASAGAITAALIAAGLSPADMERATDDALRQVQTSRWAGVRRLRSATGYFPSHGLRTWLDGFFREQIKATDGNITFRQLHKATGIELNVIAADLSLRRQIVFSHHDTPDCAVADAVVASSSIPFAFPSRLLRVTEGDTAYHHTIVDGGVWSNFPIFVFEDPAFRRFYKRSPQNVDNDRILGFLLRELGAQKPLGSSVAFVSEVQRREFQPREWQQPAGTNSDQAESFRSRALAGAVYPLAVLGRIAEWNGGMERGRWPDPQYRPLRHLLQSVNGLLAGLQPLLMGVLACIIVGVGSWNVITWLSTGQIDALFATDWTNVISYPARLASIALTIVGITIAVLVFVASLIAVAANYTLLRAMRRILYGLVTTYVAGPGAAEWFVEKRNVISLPIPPEVTTLAFNMPKPVREKLIAGASDATTARLAELLPAAARGAAS